MSFSFANTIAVSKILENVINKSKTYYFLKLPNLSTTAGKNGNEKREFMLLEGPILIFLAAKINAALQNTAHFT